MQDQTELQIDAQTRHFLENLLTDAGIPAVDDEQREQMIMELYARLDYLMTARIADSMPPEHLETFIKMNEEKRPKEELEKFMLEHLPNAQEVFQNIFIEFREMYLGNVAVNANTPADESSEGTKPAA